MDRNIFSTSHQLVGQRAAEKFGEDAAARAADHDLSDILETSETQKLGRKITADKGLGFTPERLGKFHSLVQAPP